MAGFRGFQPNFGRLQSPHYNHASTSPANPKIAVSTASRCAAPLNGGGTLVVPEGVTGIVVSLRTVVMTAGRVEKRVVPPTTDVMTAGGAAGRVERRVVPSTTVVMTAGGAAGRVERRVVPPTTDVMTAGGAAGGVDTIVVPPITVVMAAGGATGGVSMTVVPPTTVVMTAGGAADGMDGPGAGGATGEDSTGTA